MSFLTARCQSLPLYVPGDHAEGEGFIRLNTNESPYPPSLGVREAVNQQIDSLQFYNDPDCVALKAAIAKTYGVTPANVTVANGSDELLYFAFMAFAAETHPIVLPDITYSYYDLFAAALGIPMERRALLPDFTVDYRDYCGANTLIVLANPNAPTGQALPIEQIEAILQSNPRSVVLIDEAYVDFGAQSALPLINKYDNLLVVRTFSKSRSLAGARIGFGFGYERLIADMERVRSAVNLYSLSRMAQAAGVAALEENDYYMDNCRRIMESREFTTMALRELGFDVLSSKTNFLFAKPSDLSGKALQDALKARGILIRRWDTPRIRDYLRITIGTREQMHSLIDAIKNIKEATR